MSRLARMAARQAWSGWRNGEFGVLLAALFVAALEGYRHMQSDGKSEGLNALKDAYPARRPRIVKKDPGSAA